RQSRWRAVAIQRRPCATGTSARIQSARSLAATEVAAPGVGRHRHPHEQGGGLRPGLWWVLLKLGRSRTPPDPNHPSRLDRSHPRVLPMPWHSFSPRGSSRNC
ncbi:unnamed protein product, partial [Ectocarpus sp. 8 AP-2014]